MYKITIFFHKRSNGVRYFLAKKGYGLVLVSSHEERLKETRKRLRSIYDVPVSLYQKDLAQIGKAAELYNEIRDDGIEIEVLINNAGFGIAGRTETISCDLDRRMIILNDISLVELCKLFLPQMYKNRSGKILNVSSTGAFQPGPFTSTYFASKSFVLSYSKAIRYEAAAYGVRVCVLCPGATKTNFFQFEDMPTPKHAMEAKQVVEYAYKQMMRNYPVSIPGIGNKLAQLVPEFIRIRKVARMKER